MMYICVIRMDKYADDCATCGISLAKFVDHFQVVPLFG